MSPERKCLSLTHTLTNQHPNRTPHDQNPPINEPRVQSWQLEHPVRYRNKCRNSDKYSLTLSRSEGEGGQVVYYTISCPPAVSLLSASSLPPVFSRCACSDNCKHRLSSLGVTQKKMEVCLFVCLFGCRKQPPLTVLI